MLHFGKIPKKIGQKLAKFSKILVKFAKFWKKIAKNSAIFNEIFEIKERSASPALALARCRLLLKLPVLEQCCFRLRRSRRFLRNVALAAVFCQLSLSQGSAYFRFLFSLYIS